MGKLTFGGKTYQVSDGLAWPVLIVMTIFLFIYFFGFLIYGSEAVSFFLQIPRWSALLTIILLTFSIKLNETETAIFPESVRSSINFMVVWSTVYYLYAYKHWELWQLALLCIYPISALIGHVRQFIEFLKSEDNEVK
jgi:hypothetical protein